MTQNTSKFLIIEDDKFLAKMLSKTFEDNGYQTTLASSGSEGLTKSENETFNLILLDIMLGDVDGFEVLQKIRAGDKNKKTPVIILSNLGQPEDIERGRKLGASDYLVKSDLSLDSVVATARKHL